MRKRIDGLTDIVRQILEVDRPVGLQEICEEVRRKVLLTSTLAEESFEMREFQHSIRAVVAHLVRRGEAIHVDVGTYRKKRVHKA